LNLSVLYGSRDESTDEKSQIQALDRKQPGLPMKPGRCGTMTHDYKRHGTTTLFAALNVLDGKIIGQCNRCMRETNYNPKPFLWTADPDAIIQKVRRIH
jgi:hypothetical protein